ncbi:hypothetical protein J6590_061234 [Homalodisca vitripennis]|nr:hypothetical protein J6590_061234 [Homalodisca vitripennis]
MGHIAPPGPAPPESATLPYPHREGTTTSAVGLINTVAQQSSENERVRERYVIVSGPTPLSDKCPQTHLTATAPRHATATPPTDSTRHDISSALWSHWFTPRSDFCYSS